MAADDWQIVPGAAVHGPTIACGASAGLPVAPGVSGIFSFVARALTASPVVHARRVIDSAFAPCVAGSITSALLRRGSPGSTPMVFLALQTDTIGSDCYSLELDAEGRVALLKGPLAGGDGQVLARGSLVHDLGAWVHLQLEAVDNANGDVVLNVYENDLEQHPPDNPAWSPVPGVARFIDDTTAVNSGSLPLVGGFLGWGVRLAGFGDYAQLGVVVAVRQD